MIVKPLSRTDRERLKRAVNGLNRENETRQVWEVFVRHVGITLGALLIVYFIVRIIWT